jgi:hypothetical protein
MHMPSKEVRRVSAKGQGRQEGLVRRREPKLDEGNLVKVNTDERRIKIEKS